MAADLHQAQSLLSHSIGDRFRRQVEIHGTRPAIEGADETLSYDELGRSVFGLAERITKCSDGGDDPIVLLVDQGPRHVEAMLAALCAGIPYAPLDPRQPIAGLRELVQALSPGRVICQPEYSALARQLVTAEPLVLSNPANVWPGASNGPETGPDSAAYIYFTSGSTGAPKGVVDTHRNVLHNILRYTVSLNITPEDRLSVIQAPGFSGVISSTLGALLNGATLCPIDLRREGLRPVAEFIERTGVTIFHSTPALFRALASSGSGMSGVRVVRLEGDRANHTDMEIFKSVTAADAQLVNGFASTECGLICQWFANHDTGIRPGILPAGKPVIDMAVQIIDDHGNEVDPGRTGRVRVNSEFLARGYWRQPELSKSRFRTHHGHPGGRCYLTGDFGQMDSSGSLLVQGRIDDDELNDAFRERAALESRIAAHPLVADALVVRGSGTSVKPEIHMVSRDHSMNPETVRHTVTAHASAIGLEASVVIHTALPNTPDGKLDRRALRERSIPGRAGAEPVRAGTEMELQKLWRSVLALKEIGAADSFFDLGASSVQAMQLVDRIESKFGRLLTPAFVVEAPTIREQSVLLDAGEFTLSQSCLVRLSADSGGQLLFCVPGVAASALTFTALARRLPGWSVYAFEPAGLDGRPADQSVEDMAARYVSALLEIETHAPYCLAGTCFGSTVAFEMARQLGEQDREVRITAAIGDNLIPGWVDAGNTGKGLFPQSVHALRRFAYHLRRSTLSDIRATAVNELRIRFDPARRNSLQVLKAHLHARSRYRFRPHCFGSVFLLAIGEKKITPSPLWTAVALGGLDIAQVGVPSERWMTEPYVVEVAGALGRRLSSLD
ncbi:AMP-binding protein [Gammaproteobacteria bacterium]|nr:AMP-binding protein [Gammaproteobacteria bacterium]